MEWFECEWAFRILPEPKHALWVRYVDDVFLIWKGTREQLDALVDILNSSPFGIKFTIEFEVDGRLPFLDCLVEKLHSSEGTSTLSTSLYRKPTHTDRYLHFFSNHHPIIKAGIVKTLASRIPVVCAKAADRAAEIDRFITALEKNGYDRAYTRKQLRPRRIERRRAKPAGTVSLNYVPVLSEKLARMLHGFGLRSFFRTANTIRNMLSKRRFHNVHERFDVVYQIRCSCNMPSFYTGETTRRLAARLREHKFYVAYDMYEISPLAAHSRALKCQFDFDAGKVVDSDANALKLLKKEAAHIAVTSNGVNFDEGASLAKSWTLVLPCIRSN